MHVLHILIVIGEQNVKA